MRDEMKRILDKPYEKDGFFKKWLVGLSPRTKENYSNEFNDWYIFYWNDTDRAD